MTTIHLSRDERMSTILRAATEIVMESGIESATITSIANRSGVSRQWLYEFYPDVESILAAMYEEAQREFFQREGRPQPRTTNFIDAVKSETCVFLRMPVAFAMVVSYALNGGARNSIRGATLRKLILDSYESGWVEPLLAAGFSREEIYGSIMTLTNAAVGLNIAVSEGFTTLEIAERRLIGVVDSLIGSASQPLE